MNKFKFLICLALTVLGARSYSQGYRIVSESGNAITIEFVAGATISEEITTPGGIFSALLMDGFGSSSLRGAPQLPVLTRLVKTPVCDSLRITILDAVYEHIDAENAGITHKVQPAQGSRSKSDRNPEFIINNDIYSSDNFFALPLVSAGKTSIARDLPVADITFAPVAYNPVSNKIRVCTKATVLVEFANPDFNATNSLKRMSSPVFGIDGGTVINPPEKTRDEFASAPISYLIIAHSMFRDNEQLNAFVEWKKKLGYLIEIAYTDETTVGTDKNSIQSYIKSKFEAATPQHPAPVFLLLVGDNEQIPAFQGTTEDQAHVTDLPYATMVGSDHIPDCYYGRLSAQNQTQLSAQIEKILMYEQYTMPDPTYLGDAVLIAGFDENYSPTHANGQIRYIYQNYINIQNPRYTNVMTHFHDCSSQSVQIRNEISNGAGWVNYSAHGEWDGWYLPEFNVSQVSSLQNNGKYGVIIGNCCLSGRFERPECFGEALLRAENKGAMAYIGASNSSYWDEDFYWAVGIRNNINANPTYNANALGTYDRLFHSHGEDPSQYVSTLGGMIFAGNMSVQNSTSGFKKYYWEIYHCFGDPSVRPFLGIPSVIEADFTPVAAFGTESLTIETEPFAYVAITDGSELLNAVFADENGTATLDISHINSPDEYIIAITAQNRIPYFTVFRLIAANTAYIVPKKAGIANGTDFLTDTEFNLDVELQNVGSVSAGNVYATVSTEDSQVLLISDSVFAGAMTTQESFSQNGAFKFKYLSQLTDNQIIKFTLHIHWDTVEILRNLNVQVKLPDIRIYSTRTDIDGQIAYAYMPGDEVDFVITNRNCGHAELAQGLQDLTCNYSGATVLSPSSQFHNLAQGSISEKTFRVKISENVPEKSVIPFYLHTLYGNRHIIDTMRIMIGAATETFESGDFSQFDWKMQNMSWRISNVTKFAGNYSARSAKSPGAAGISKMSITTTTENPSQLSYYRKVSSEAGYDIFYLYMDGTVVDKASGVSNWEFVSIDVPAGTHKFTFSYEKDYWYSVDSDCVWIDNIIMPEDGEPVVEDIIDEVGVAQHTIGFAKAFPNPAHSQVTIDSERPVAQITLSDLTGRALLAENLYGETRHVMNIGKLHAGVYILLITYTDRQRQTIKIIKR